jgi:hypothetical protein
MSLVLQQEACMEAEYRDQKQLLITEVSPQLRLIPYTYHKPPTSTKWKIRNHDHGKYRKSK